MCNQMADLVCKPALLTLLSSTSVPAISPLFSTHTDPNLPSDSIIASVADNVASSSSLRPKHSRKGSIIHQTIHLQSPNITSTYIQAGLARTNYAERLAKGKGRSSSDDEIGRPLGIELFWFGIQFRTLGKREMAFEIGLVDSRGREGIVRCSSHKVCMQWC